MPTKETRAVNTHVELSKCERLANRKTILRSSRLLVSYLLLLPWVVLSSSACKNQTELPKPQGGQVHGYVVATFKDQKVTGAQSATASIRVPKAKVFLKQLPGGVIVSGSESTTNPHGYFIIPKQAPGRYQLCAEADGFDGVCEPNAISISTGTFVLDHDVSINPRPGFLRGRVVLKDGQPCYRESQSFRTLVQAAVSLVDTPTNTVVSGPISANSMGWYILPKVPRAGSYRLKAHCDSGDLQTDVSLADRDLIGAAPFDLSIPNSSPKILTMVPSIAGRAVRRATPGAIAKVTVAAEDPDADKLHYKWDDGSLGFTSSDSAELDWKLPSVPGTNLFSLGYVASFAVL